MKIFILLWTIFIFSWCFLKADQGTTIKEDPVVQEGTIIEKWENNSSQKIEEIPWESQYKEDESSEVEIDGSAEGNTEITLPEDSSESSETQEQQNDIIDEQANTILDILQETSNEIDDL